MSLRVYFQYFIVLILLLIAQAEAFANPFIFTVNTNRPGASTTGFNLVSLDSNYTLSWEEVGNASNNGSLTVPNTNYNIVFPNAGRYRISIDSAGFTSIKNGLSTDREMVEEINQWGSIAWSNVVSAFESCDNMRMIATDVPDLSNVTSIHKMFLSCDSMGSSGNWNWDVSNITNFSWAFISSDFNSPDAENWDVSNGIDFSNMFFNITLFNLDLSNWDVGNGTTFVDMFFGCESFEGNGIENWDMSNAVNVSNMFRNTNLTNVDLSNWDVSNIRDFSAMFVYCYDFLGVGLENWDVSSGENFGAMFLRCELLNVDLSNWDVRRGRSFYQMFARCLVFDRDLSNWDVSRGRSFSQMFSGASLFNADISNWDMSRATTIRAMFFEAERFNQNLASWDISNVVNLDLLFNGSGMSQANYDNLLVGWATQDVNNNLNMSISDVNFVRTNYCVGYKARQSLIEDHGWTFNDGNLGCGPGGTDPSSAALWLRADKGYGSTWADQSIYGNDATATQMPTIQDTINFNPALSFNSNSILEGALNLQSTEATAFSVITKANGPGGVLSATKDNATDFSDSQGMSFFVQENSNAIESIRSNNSIHSISIDSTAEVVYTQLRPDSSILMNNLGNQASTAYAHQPFDLNNYFIGGRKKTASTSEPYQGLISEVILIDTSLGEVDLLKINSYLTIKYGLPPVASNGTQTILSGIGDTVWSSANAGAFTNNIIGISKDTVSALYQNVSKPTYGDSRVTISTSADFTSPNAVARNAIQGDISYLILSDNGGDIGFDSLMTLGDIHCRERYVVSDLIYRVDPFDYSQDVYLKFEGYDESHTLLTSPNASFTDASPASALGADGSINYNVSETIYIRLAKPFLGDTKLQVIPN